MNVYLCVCLLSSSFGESISFVGACTGASKEAKEIRSEYEDAIADLTKIGESIPKKERKTVLYEISTPTSDFPARGWPARR